VGSQHPFRAPIDPSANQGIDSKLPKLLDSFPAIPPGCRQFLTLDNATVFYGGKEKFSGTVETRRNPPIKKWNGNFHHIPPMLKITIKPIFWLKEMLAILAPIQLPSNSVDF
jgi:hypothetical protein